MIEFPGTEQEVKQLERFLTATENLPTDTALDEMREHALAHAERLSNAVNIGFAGEFGAGKSSLANMLAGADILPTGLGSADMPLVIVAYADEPETTIGWWNRDPRKFAGIALEKATAESPDFITVGLNAPALREISLFDLPDVGAPNDSENKALELLEIVDCVIWCTNGLDPWNDTEKHFWQQTTQDIKKNSLLAVTHTDLRQVHEALDRVLDQLGKAEAGNFRAIVPIGTPLAVRAMSQEPEPDLDLWNACGGEDLVTQVLVLAAEHRSRCLMAARKDLKEHFLPQLPAQPANVTTDAAEAAIVQPAETQPSQPLINPILEDWLAAIASVKHDLQETTGIEPGDFLQRCHDIIQDFAERLDDDALPDPEATWVPEEFEKAADLLLLLQFETGSAPLRDAISVLAQLSDTLAWAGSSAPSAQSKTGT